MVSNKNIIDLLPKVRGSYRENSDLSKINWFNVGGMAQVMFRPADAEDLSSFLKNKPEGIIVTVLGVGSNLLVRDGGIDGVVIRLGKGFTDISVRNNELTAGAGALSFNVSMFAAQNSLTGLEFLSGIPGTIGGALYMNAGAYGSDVSAILKSAEAIDESGTLHILTQQDIGYIYRGNTLPEGMIFTKGTFIGKPGDRAEIENLLTKISSQREDTQPIKSRTSGSTFKNPEGKKAWELIDAAGCRGMKVGGAQVSEKHCNFFINTGGATSDDIEKLGEIVRKRVKEKTGVSLEWEVKIIGKRNDQKK